MFRTIAGGSGDGDPSAPNFAEAEASCGELKKGGWGVLPSCPPAVFPVHHPSRSGEKGGINGDGSHSGDVMETSLGGGGGLIPASSGGGRLRDIVDIRRDAGFHSDSLRYCVRVLFLSSSAGLQDARILMADAVVRRLGLVCGEDVMWSEKGR